MGLKLTDWANHTLSIDEKNLLSDLTYDGSIPSIRKFYEHNEGHKHYETLKKIINKILAILEVESKQKTMGYPIDHLTPVNILEGIAFADHLNSCLNKPNLIKTTEINTLIGQIKNKITLLDKMLSAEGLAVDGSVSFPSISSFHKELHDKEHWNEILTYCDEEETQYERLHEHASSALESFRFINVIEEAFSKLYSVVNNDSDYKISGVKIPSKRLYNIRSTVFNFLDVISDNKRFPQIALDSIDGANFYSLIGYISGLITIGAPYPSSSCRTEIIEAIRIWEGKG